MAETLVLANLIINADGTIRAVTEAGKSIDLFGQKVKDGEARVRSGFERIGLTTKRLTEGFLNVRHLITGLFAGFSVGGIVFAMAQLAQETLTASKAFQSAKTGAEDFFRALVLGETTMERLTRKTADLAKSIGLKTAESLREEMETTRKFIEEESKKLEAATASLLPVVSSFGPTGTASSILAQRAAGFFGMGQAQLPPTAEQVSDVAKSVAAAKAHLADLQKAYDNLGVSAKKAAEAIDTGGPKSINEMILGPSAAKEQTLGRDAFRTFESIEGGLDRMMDEVKAGIRPWDDFNNRLETAVGILKELGFSMEQIGQIDAVKFSDSVKQQKADIDDMVDSYENWQFILGLVSQTAAAAADAGIISAKRLFQINQTLMSIDAIKQGMIEIAKGVAAAAVGDFGGAALHEVAAGLFFAAAAFHGVAAVRGPQGAGGVGGHGGGRGSRFTEAPETQAPQAPGGTYIFNIDGSIIGSDPNEIGRWIMEVQAKAQRDGLKAA